MSSDSLEVLFDKLNAGDPDAAERFFLAYEPYLRIVVRRQLSATVRSKFDSMDVVQSVWADVLDGLREGKLVFSNTNQLRAFLVKMTRNRFIDRLRHHRGALEREIRMPDRGIDSLPEDRAPRVSEEFYADELWEQLRDFVRQPTVSCWR